MSLRQEPEEVKIPKAVLSAEIKQHVDAFLKKGGVIQVFDNNATYDRNEAGLREEYEVMK